MASSVQEKKEAGKSLQPDLNRRQTVRFLVCLTVLPLCLYLLPFAVIRTHWFIRFAGSQFSPSLDYSFTTAGQNADVVIYGDSSAFYGVSPLQMSQDLGLKVINLPNTGGSLPVINDLPLRYYLSVNRAPRVIVLYFAPWDLDYLHESSRFLFEGEEVLLRHGSAREIASFARNHPFELLEYPFMAYSTGPKAALISALHHADRFKVIAANRGHLEAASVTAGGGFALANLRGPCLLPARLLGKDSASATSLLKRYSSGSTQVLLFLAPVPGCENVSAVTDRDYSNLKAAPPRVLAPISYKDDDFYIHLDPSVVPVATNALTLAVRQELSQSVQ